MSNVLIIGNGKAGQRHARTAMEFGLQVSTSDPYAPATYPDWRQALQDRSWDCAVIASPPDCHLEQIWECANANIPTLCEKPLCGIGQGYDFDFGPFEDKLYIAYNYAFHPGLRTWLARSVDISRRADFHLSAEQSRPIPPWGMLLDNISHDLFIISMITSGIKEIVYAKRSAMNAGESWFIMGHTNMGGFSISDSIFKSPCERVAYIESPFGKVDIDADSSMFTLMWDNFLAGRETRNLKSAKAVQKLLNDTFNYNRYYCREGKRHDNSAAS